MEKVRRVEISLEITGESPCSGEGCSCSGLQVLRCLEEQDPKTLQTARSNPGQCFHLDIPCQRSGEVEKRARGSVRITDRRSVC